MYDSDPHEPWIERLKPDEFALLNWSWAGRISGRDEAVRAMRSGGVARLAPIAFDLEFDPAYYREVHPEYVQLSDAETYERWLTHDIAQSWPGSAEQHLRWLGLNLRAYPAALDWRRYIALTPFGGPNRWSAIEHLIRDGFRELPELPVAGEGAAEFLHALGMQYRGRDDHLAIKAFSAARRHGDRGYDAVHQLADAHYRLEHWEPAFAAFQEAAAHEHAGLWTFVNGARSALKLGRIEDAFDLVLAGKRNAAGDYWWRQVVRESIDAEFGVSFERARTLYASGARLDADDLLRSAVDAAAARWQALDPLGRPLQPARDGRVVMLANTDLRQCNHYRIEQKQQLFESWVASSRCSTRAARPRSFLSALPGASAALFYRLPAFPMNVRAIDTARAMGVPELLRHRRPDLRLRGLPRTARDLRRRNRRVLHQLQLGVPLFRAAMARCDYAIASTTALAEHMKPVVRSGRAAVLPNGLDDRNLWALETPPRRVRAGDEVVIFYGLGHHGPQQRLPRPRRPRPAAGVRAVAQRAPDGGGAPGPRQPVRGLRRAHHPLPLGGGRAVLLVAAGRGGHQPGGIGALSHHRRPRARSSGWRPPRWACLRW
jgi:tetratricopeptide (TPR) repeat protein